MNIPRYAHSASILSNGKVLVCGGQENTTYFSSREVYDPITEIWMITNSMNNARLLYTASVLLDGKVLVTGGQKLYSYLNSDELYSY